MSFSFEKKKAGDLKQVNEQAATTSLDSPNELEEQYFCVKKQIKIVHESLEEEETRSTKANL